MPESKQNTAHALSMIGLAQRAGRTASGETACETAIRSGEAAVVIVSRDISEGMLRKFSNRCFFYKVPLHRVDCTKEELGHAIGRGTRSCLAVTEPGLAANIIRLTENIEL